MRLFAAMLCLCLTVWPPDTVVAADGEADALLEFANEPWKGDLGGILKRGFLRYATANSPLFFSRDGIEQRGLALDIAHALEAFLSKTYPKKRRHLKVVVMPMARDAMLPAVLDGRADFAAANLTITPERKKLVAFTQPTIKDVRELVVSGPAAPTISSFDDLPASKLHLRRSSSYFEHVSALNAARKLAGKPLIPIEEMDENLEDYHLLEMVNVGLLPVIILDSHKAKIWQRVFDNVKVHKDLAVNEGGQIAWAVRPNNPRLLAALNKFIKTIRQGSLLGNILIKRYIKDPKWIDNVRSDEALSRFEATLDIVKRYAGDYDFDWLMITAQGYQESKLDQSKRSRQGAVGIMQIMPKTAKDPVVNIPNIEDPKDNIHAGVKYLRFLRKTYFDDSKIAPLDRMLFAFASYNAGPGAIRRARARAKKMGLDPNRWFDNVEIATARAISREPVIYVRNIYKYYIAYKLLAKARAAQAVAKEPRAK